MYLFIRLIIIFLLFFFNFIPYLKAIEEQLGINESFNNQNNDTQRTIYRDYNGSVQTISPNIYQSLSTMLFNDVNTQNNEIITQLYLKRVYHDPNLYTNEYSQNSSELQAKTKKNRLIRTFPFLEKLAGFATGTGIFASATSGNLLPRYNFQGGSILSGTTYQVNNRLLLGVFSSYAGIYAKFINGSKLTDNSTRAGAFATYGEATGIYLNVLMSGAYNNILVNRRIHFNGMDRSAHVRLNSGDLDTMISSGYNFKLDQWLFGPMINYQYTLFGTAKFNEIGADALNFHGMGWNTSSMLLTLGCATGYCWNITHDITLVPQGSLGWQYELMQNPYSINGNISNLEISSRSNTPQRNSLYTSIGFSLEWIKKLNTTFVYQVNAANKDILSQNFFLSAGIKL